MILASKTANSMSYSNAQVTEIAFMAIGFVISLYSLCIVVASNLTKTSYPTNYKKLLLAACIIQLLVISGHLADSTISPLIEQGYQGLENLQLFLHFIIYRLQLHFLEFILFSWAIYSRYKILKDVIRYTNTVHYILETVMFLSTLMFLTVQLYIVISVSFAFDPVFHAVRPKRQCLHSSASS